MTFWDHHGVLFLVCATIFPRLTILFGTGLTASFGVFGWLGWLALPRFVVAYYATVSYGSTDPFLVAIAWFLALTSLIGMETSAARRAS